MGIAFERIVIVMLENSTRANVLADPYMSALRSKGVLLANSLDVTSTGEVLERCHALVPGSTRSCWATES